MERELARQRSSRSRVIAVDPREPIRTSVRSVVLRTAIDFEDMKWF
jgi:hypothetical protein